MTRIKDGHSRSPRCPQCQSEFSRVLDSRTVNKTLTRGVQEEMTRRRRQCPNGHRFTTYERIHRGHGNTKSDNGILTEVRKYLQDADILLTRHLYGNSIEP